MDGEQLSRCGGYVGLVGFDASDRNQWQADVAHSLEQAMECGLVGDKAGDDRGAVVLAGQAQSVKPSGPSRVEVALEADFVPSGLALTAGRCLAHDRNVGPHVVSEHHHMW